MLARTVWCAPPILPIKIAGIIPLTSKQGNPVASFIASISQNSYRRQAGGYLKKSLPPLEFTYSEAVVNETVQEIDAASLENLPAGLDGLRTSGWTWTARGFRVS